MQDSIERFNSHAIHARIQSLRERNETLPIDEEDPKRRDGVTRFVRVCNLLTDLVDNSDPTLWTPNLLQRTQTIIEQLHSAAVNYGSNPKPQQHLRALQSSADNSLDQLTTIPLAISLNRTENKEHSFTQYLQQVQSSLGEIDSHKAKAKETELAIEEAETDFLLRLQAT